MGLKNDPCRQIKILDIAHKFGINLIPARIGNFDYKCICPSKDHKGGHENTPSCLISSSENSFYCFSCNYGTRPINFYMACADVDFTTARREMLQGLPHAPAYTFELEPDNFFTLMKISETIRKNIQQHSEDLVWIDQLTKRLDVELQKLERTDVIKAQNLLEVLKIKFQQRYS